MKIEHEEIPNYMEAMTMMFDVKESSILTGLAAGDNVTFRMLVTEEDGWIEAIQKLDGPRTPLPPLAPGLRRVREVEPLAVGDRMPDYVFTNTLGEAVHLTNYLGDAVGLTFIFTRCPFPTFCQRLSGSFSATQKKLQAMTNGPTNWRLLSITIDPEYDTPERLKAYARRYDADPKRWDFLTGDLTDITAIGEQFGLQFWRPDPAAPINHNVRTVVINAAGRVHWMTVENEWAPSSLAEQIVEAARVGVKDPPPKAGTNSPPLSTPKP